MFVDAIMYYKVVLRCKENCVLLFFSMLTVYINTGVQCHVLHSQRGRLQPEHKAFGSNDIEVKDGILIFKSIDNVGM